MRTELLNFVLCFDFFAIPQAKGFEKAQWNFQSFDELRTFHYLSFSFGKLLKTDERNLLSCIFRLKRRADDQNQRIIKKLIKFMRKYPPLEATCDGCNDTKKKQKNNY